MKCHLKLHIDITLHYATGTDRLLDSNNGCNCAYRNGLLLRLLCGVRQGGVLSPFLFAIFIDSIVDKVKATGVGCYLNSVCVSILLYADDIILTAPSVRTLQHLLDVCQQELDYLDMSINAKKILLYSDWPPL